MTFSFNDPRCTNSCSTSSRRSENESALSMTLSSCSWLKSSMARMPFRTITASLRRVAAASATFSNRRGRRMTAEFEGNDRIIWTNVDLASMKNTSSWVMSKAAVRSSIAVSHLLNNGRLIVLFSFRGNCAGAGPSSWSNTLRCEFSSLA